MYGIVYKATCEFNGKSYIGQTIKSLSNRKYNHKIRMKNKNGFAFHDALMDYGWDTFSWEILCECKDAMEMSLMEENYIKKYDSLLPKGYNMITKTNGYSKETRKKMSESLKGKNNPNYGKTGEKNPKALYNYTFKLPDGTIYETGALTTFCRKMGFSWNILIKICNKENYKTINPFYQGWTVEKVRKG